MCFTERDRLRKNAGVTAIWNHGLGVLLFAVRVPHLARSANHGRHRCIDNDIAGNVQIRNAFVRIHHRQFRSLRNGGLNVFFDFRLLVCW